MVPAEADESPQEQVGELDHDVPPAGGGGSFKDAAEDFKLFEDVYASCHDGEFNLGDFGEALRNITEQMHGTLGDLARQAPFTNTKSFGYGDQDAKSTPSQELLPMPFIQPSVEDMRDAYTCRGEIGDAEFNDLWVTPPGLSHEMQKVRLRFVGSWVWMMVTALNYMYSGLGRDSHTPSTFHGPRSRSQDEVWKRLLTDADLYLGEMEDFAPHKDWESLISGRRLTYQGEVVAKAERLTLAQAEPALPPGKLAASINIMDIVPEHLQALLRDPSKSIKPVDEWPEVFARELQ